MVVADYVLISFRFGKQNLIAYSSQKEREKERERESEKAGKGTPLLDQIFTRKYSRNKCILFTILLLLLVLLLLLL